MLSFKPDSSPYKIIAGTKNPGIKIKNQARKMLKKKLECFFFLTLFNRCILDDFYF